MVRLFLTLTFMLHFLNVFAADTYKLEADEIYGSGNEYITAKGNVVLSFKNTRIAADKAVYHPSKKMFEAEGNVKLSDDSQNFTADRIIYNISTETGEIENVKGYFGEEYYICARNMSKTGKLSYLMEGVIVTTCEGSNPAWAFEFYKAEAEIDGYIFGDHVSANVKGIPVLYSPKMFYPLKVSRQTGFLIPQLGYHSDLGLYFNESFFWAIDYDKDMTIGSSFFSERGIHGMGEFRYAIENDSSINLVFDGIEDRKDDIDVKGRWSYSLKADLKPFEGFELIADSSDVSDYMYMRDFGKYTLNTTFNTENVFYQYYAMKYHFSPGTFSIFHKTEYKYNDKEKGFLTSKLTQRPSVSLEKYGAPVYFAKLSYDIMWSNVNYSDYTRNYSSGNNINQFDYTRLHSKLTLYDKYRLRYFTLTPSLSVNHTVWQDWKGNINTGHRNSFSYIYRTGNGYERILPEASLKLDLNEIYSNYGEGKHGVLNTVEYNYTQELDQDGLPNYLENDRISGKNSLSFTMYNYYNSANWSMSLLAKQSLNLKNARLLEPLELKFNLKSYEFSLSSESKLNYYLSDGDTLKTLEVEAAYRASRFFTKAKYNYDSNQMQQYNTSFSSSAGVYLQRVDLEGEIIWKGMNPYLSFSGLESVENRLSAKWKEQCWNFAVAFATEKYIVNKSSGNEWERDYKVELKFELKGLGGSSFDAYKNTVSYN